MLAGFIFISYRRDDEAGTAGRLYDHLVRVAHIPREQIFLDVDNIVPGTNFVQKLQNEVARCELMIAVIGRRWVQAINEDGTQRLADPYDFVRIEIEAALNREIPLIPLLIDGARPPKENQLPISLHVLCQQQALEVRNANFDGDISRLVKVIKWHQNPAAKKHAESKADANITRTPPLPAGPVHPVSESKAEANNTRTDEKPSSKREHISDPQTLSNRKTPELSNDLRKLGGLYYMAEAGDSQCLYEVGTRLEAGHSISQNLDLALNYYQRAARAGYGRAHVRIKRLLPKIKAAEAR